MITKKLLAGVFMVSSLFGTSISLEAVEAPKLSLSSHRRLENDVERIISIIAVSESFPFETELEELEEKCNLLGVKASNYTKFYLVNFWADKYENNIEHLNELIELSHEICTALASKE